MQKKRVISCVTSDLVTDQRVHKMCETLTHMELDVKLIGRQKRRSLPLEPRKYSSHRIKCLFQKGALFYAEFNFRLFVLLLFSKADVLIANDADTGLAVYLTSLLKGIPLVYDSHEYFTEVPELQGRDNIKAIWSSIEKRVVKRMKVGYTVSGEIAKLLEEKYARPFQVVRNFPIYKERTQDDQFKKEDVAFSIIYQGSVNVSRGLEEMIQAMKLLQGCQLNIYGDGDVIDSLKAMVVEEKLEAIVKFHGVIPLQDLWYRTCEADLGISLEKAEGLSYTNALPNKLFDYVMAEIPSLISALPFMEEINDKYKIGSVVDSVTPEAIAQQVNLLKDDQSQYEQLVENTRMAKSELSWENESKVLVSTFPIGQI